MSSACRLVALLALIACVLAAPARAASVRAAAGTGPQVQPAFDAFRAEHAPLNANVVGSQPGGRREINWDGVPNALAEPNVLPGSFFNTTSPRGVVFTTPGTGLAVSGAGAGPTRFGSYRPDYPTAFAAFSPQRLFSPVGATRTDVGFRVPGADTPATTAGFGLVFADVDANGSTTVEPFDAQGTSLGTHGVPAAPGNGLFSFLSVTPSHGQRIARVVVISGSAPLGAADVTQGGAADVVVLDDMVYAEPQAIGAVVTADPPPVSEGSGAATVTLARSNAVGAASVAYATAGGSATPDADYLPVTGRASFAEGETTATVQIPLLTDPAAEPTESFGLTLSAPRGAVTLGMPATAIVTLTDVAFKEAPPQVLPPAPDTTAPRVTSLLTAAGTVRRAALARGVRLIVGSSEAGRLTLRVRAGRRVLATLPVRALGAGATAVRLRVPAVRIGAKVRRVVVELGVTDAAGNVGRAALTLRLSR